MTVTPNGNNTNCTVDMTAGPLPLGAAAQFGSTALTISTANVTTPLSVTTAPRHRLGTYTFNVTATRRAGCQGNGGTDSGNITLIVTALGPSTTTVTCPATQAYAGVALTPCTAVVTGPGGLNQSLIVSYSSNLNVGTATASATFRWYATHAGSSDSKTFAITKASSTVSVSLPGQPGLHERGHRRRAPPAGHRRRA